MRKRRFLAALLVLALAFTMVPGTVLGASPAQIPFWDVVGGAYATPVTALYEIGVVGGTSPTTYSPSAPVTRAQMAALLIRALRQTDLAKQSFDPKYTDVPSGYWAFGEVMLANSLAIVRGVSDTEFRPNAPVTYPQATVMVLRALGYDNGRLNYPAGYVLKAQELGLIEGLRWDMNGEMTRGEVAVLLANAIFKVDHFMYGKTLSQELFRHAASAQIKPNVSVLPAGSTRLQAVGLDAYGKELVGLATSWSVTGGSATIGNDGILSVQSGPISVKATLGGQAVTRTFDIISQIAVTPETSTVKPGEKVQLKVLDPKNPKVELSGAVWTVKSGAASISSSGLLTASGSGVITVEAAVGSMKATAVVNSVTGLVLEPATVIAVPGEVLTFKVKTADGAPFAGPVQWSVDGAGSISQDGKFVVASGNPPTIKAQSGGLTGAATVQVVHRLALTPAANQTVLKGKTLQFVAKGVTTDGKEVDVPVTWNSTGRIGIVGADGLFIGTASGTGQVIASFRTLQQSASLSVSGDPATVALTASRSTVPANSRSPITLTATLKDSNGIAVNMATPVQFFLDDGTKGTLSATTATTQAGVATVTFTPSSSAGNFKITAAATDLTVLPGVISLSSYAPVPSKVVISAYPNPVAAAANSNSTVTAKLIDSEGYEIPNTTGTTQVVTLSFNNTTAASLSSGQILIAPNSSQGSVAFTAGNAGESTIYGAANWPVQGVTIRTMQVGPAVKVGIRPGIASTRADNSGEMVIYAEVMDANGVVRTQDYGTSITLSGVTEDGLSTIQPQTLLTSAGVATFRLRSNKAGTYTFTATSGTLVTGTATGTFEPGPATGLKLSVTPTSDIAADSISTVKLRAEIVDAHGNRVPNATGAISFAKTVNSNSTSLPAQTSVQAVNGVAEIVLTSTVYPSTTGDTFKATSTGLSDSNTVTVKSRITGVASKLEALVATGTALVGNKVQVTVYVKDSLGQIVTSANNRLIRLIPNSPTATVTGSGLTEAGVATFTVTDTVAHTVALTASGDGLLSDNTKSVGFNPGTPARILLKTTSDELSADNGQSYVQLTAEAQDSYGNVVNTAVAVNLTLSRNDLVTLSSNGLYTGNFVLVRSTNLFGSVTVNGTSSIPVTPITISTFVPGAPDKVRIDAVTTGKAGAPITFRARIIDTNGHVLTGMNTGTLMSAVGVIVNGSAGNTMSVSNNNLYALPSFQGNGSTHGSAGLAQGVATFTYLNPKAETVTITPVAYYNGRQLTAETGVVTTTPGNATKLTITPGKAGLSSGTSESTTLQAVLADLNDNPVVSSEPDTFTFSFSTTAYIATNDQTSVNTTNGRAVIQVFSKVHSAGGETEITVTSAKTGLSTKIKLKTDQAPAAPIVFATDYAGLDNTVSAGEPSARLVVTVEARNTDQTVTVYVNGVQVPLYFNSTGGSPYRVIPAGQTSLVGYILRGDMGVGTKTIRVVVQNDVAASPMSNVQTILVQ